MMMRNELHGRVIKLRPLREADMRQRAEWTADAELVWAMGADPVEEPYVSPEDEQRRNLDWLKSRQRAGDQLYGVEVHGRFIGDIDVAFFPALRRAELTVFIGERSAWGKGYGTEAVNLILVELANVPGLDHVEVNVRKGNDRALAFWTKLGFRERATDDAAGHWLRRPLGRNCAKV